MKIVRQPQIEAVFFDLLQSEVVMARKSAFVKISGDLHDSPAVMEWIRGLAQEYFVVICVGGGTQITRALKERGMGNGVFGPLGRELETFAQRQVARDVLEENQVSVQDALADQNIHAITIIPVLDCGSVLCHVNGDIHIRAAYLGFDVLYVVTTPERAEAKKKDFAGLPKIQIISF